jgi:hypothetical protein
MRQRACGVWAIVAAGVLVAVLACAGVASAQIAGAPVVPILGDPQESSVTPFEGATAVPNPIGGVPSPPQNPFMAPNGRNNLHNDAYMTDTYAVSGPLGDGPKTSSLFLRECASVTFDTQGRIVSICVGLDRPVLALLDPHTLQALATMPLPVRNLQSGSNPFTDFSGGGYYYLDNQDRAVLPTNERHLIEASIVAGPSFAVTRNYDLSGEIPADDGIISVLPDWSGRFWFVTRHGIVGTVDRGTGDVHTVQLDGEGISNSFAVDETGGVYIVSDKALYRFDAGPDGAPRMSWREVYPNSGIHKPGQSDAGSGTTPTLMGGDWVAITDNADPMDIQVYKRGLGVTGSRQVCSEPVFRQGASSTDQSLIGTDHSLIAENNYGYSGIAATMNGGVTEPGLTRVDVVAQSTLGKTKRKKKRHKGKRKHALEAAKPANKPHHKRKHKKRTKRAATTTYRCQTVWTSEERAPSVVPKLSLGNGLVYTYTKPPREDNLDAWYLTALDFRTGQTVYRRLAGTGFGYNNNYAPVTLAPDGRAYVGVLGGIVEFP